MADVPRDSGKTYFDTSVNTGISPNEIIGAESIHNTQKKLKGQAYMIST